MNLDGFAEINIARLMAENLRHIRCEIDTASFSFWRIARESHQLLLRAMIEALRGSANLQIVSKKGRKNKKKTRYYRIGNDSWKKIDKVKISGCQVAWRYSKPESCNQEEIPQIDGHLERRSEENEEKQLIGFFDMLAMIQTECCMCSFVFSEPVAIDDEDMFSIEWLHFRVRNEDEHFIPKSYYVANQDLKAVSILCFSVVKQIMEHGPIILDEQLVSVKNEIDYVYQLVRCLPENGSLTGTDVDK